MNEAVNEVIWFGKYRVLAEIGRGNSSIVYLAEHLKLGGYRAIKCIHKDSDNRPQLIQEARLLKNLRHPGIPIIYDIEEDEHDIYMIEEYIQGESIGEFILHQKFVPEQFICEKGIEICKIINYLHHFSDGPVIYRDLKPEHIILCGARVKLIDFGIAETHQEKGTDSSQFGTPHFTDPCLESGHSTAADIYSVGKVLLYLAEHSECRISSNLTYIGEKASCPDTGKRFSTVEELQEALESNLKRVHQKENPHNQKHLLNIAVTGSEAHIGATHFAVALTVYLNQNRNTAVYLEKNKKKAVQKTLRQSSGFTEKDGIYHYKKFSGQPLYGEGVECDTPDQGICVSDYGSDHVWNVEEEELVILLLGNRPWELEQSVKTAEHLLNCSQLRLVCNHGDYRQARRFADRFHREVFCFPMDEDPFHMTREKMEFFDRLLQAEAGEGRYRKRIYWGSRLWKWLRKHTFIHGTG